MLGSDSEHETVRVAEDPCGNGDELSPQARAVRAAVRTGIEAAERLKEGGDVEREERRPHPGAVHRHEARRKVTESRPELRVLDLLLDESPHAEPGLELGHVPVEVGQDEAVGVGMRDLADLEKVELVQIDRPAAP